MKSDKLSLIIETIEAVNDGEPVLVLRNESRDGQESYVRCEICAKKDKEGNMFLLVS